MEPEIEPSSPKPHRPEPDAQPGPNFEFSGRRPDSPQSRDLRWVFMGPQGLRAGWSVLIFLLLIQLFLQFLGTVCVALGLIRPDDGFTPGSALAGEIVSAIALLAAAAILSLIEERRIPDYNLRDPQPLPHFASGLLAGFAALSMLVGALAWAGWLRFGPIALTGRQIFFYAALWGCMFLLVGCVEEGTMRCYLLFTLTRGINFWWAVGIESAMCGDLLLTARGENVWGVYALALLGLIPCLALYLRKTPGAGFWQAAWVTSTYFAFGHLSNPGENWIGILAAGAIGFVFCVSVRLTGSAWWAIGCHAAWDWAETYFYGTADSGLSAKGHFLTTWPRGTALGSGGTAGPEGSVLSLAIVLLLLAALLALYGRRERAGLVAQDLRRAAS
ncbi:MAG: type II CAAX endopeptidase family protein [Terracidiphilus sp.]